MASYRRACQWIAANDDAGSEATEDDIAGYISVVLVADVWEKDASEVAKTVMNYRRKFLKTLTREAHG